MKLRTLLGIVVGFALLSCGDDSSADTPGEIVLIEVSGDSQDVTPLGTSAPLVVQVLDTEGDTLAGTVVTFAVTVGAGTVVGVDTADADGFASTVYTATTTAGLRTVRARAGSDLFFTVAVGAGSAATLTSFSGNEQGANVSTGLPLPLGAKVADAWGNGVAGVPVVWQIVSGGGSLADDTTLTNASGVATVTRTLGATVGGQVVSATTLAVADTAEFHSTGKKAMTLLAGGNNVPNQCTSDLWIHGNYGYTGTWGNCEGVGSHVLKIWNVSAGVVLDTTINIGAGTVSDNEVSADGALMLVTSEGGGTPNGLYLYSLAVPARPALLDSQLVATGLHTGTFATIGGQLYVFGSKNPGSPALMVFRIQVDSVDKIVQVASVAQPANYGIHDQYLRDGLAFVSVWNTGMRIYDVGDGRLGGSPASPQLIGSIVTGSSGLSCNCVHNSWWYHDAQGGKRYLFIGQEGPTDFETASGDIHVVDVSNMAAPEEVAFYHMAGAGVHNFWMDEARGILYAAYYNGGVVALDVTGTLTGNLASREIARIQPGGALNTFTWGVMLANGALWASDMVSGLWKLSPP